jgi:hypothetical protein
MARAGQNVWTQLQSLEALEGLEVRRFRMSTKKWGHHEEGCGLRGPACPGRRLAGRRFAAVSAPDFSSQEDLKATAAEDGEIPQIR